MAVITPAVFMDGTTSNASQARRAFGTHVSQGVARSTDMLVTATGTPDMKTNVAAGRVWVEGTSSAVQGIYFGENDASVALTHAAQNATNNRIDLVIVQFLETLYDGMGVGIHTYQLAVVTGIPAASPTVPATPANSYVLAEVLVRSTSNGGGTIIAGNITDRRNVSGRNELRLRRVANQAIGSATAAAISWDTEDVDTEATNTVGSTVTLGAGVWIVSFKVNASAGMSGGGTAFLTHNGINYPAYITTNNAEALVTTLIDATAAATFTANVFNAHSGSLNFTARLQAIRVTR